MDLKDSKTRERLGIVLLALVLSLSGYLMIKDESAPIGFKEGAVKSEKKYDSSDSESGTSDSSPVSSNKIIGKININTAAIEELDTLPGIGEKTAQKIIDYRKSHGGFKTLIELKEVSGIGDAKYEAVQSSISL